MRTQLSVMLPRGNRTPAFAREALQSLSGALARELPDMRLLVSELATDSVKRGGDGPVRLDIAVRDHAARAELIDQGSDFRPRAREDDLGRVGGWGLHLVDSLSNRWGTAEGSTHVWFEMKRDRTAA